MSKTAQTMIERHGKDYYNRIGGLGGKAKVKTKGFGSNPELAREAGRKGGLKAGKKGSKWMNNDTFKEEQQ